MLLLGTSEKGSDAAAQATLDDTLGAILTRVI